MLRKLNFYATRASIFLVTAALIAGLAGCTGGGDSCYLSIASTAGGSVTEPGEGTFTYNNATTVVNVVAMPDPGCHFLNWNGAVDTIADVNAAATNITITTESSYIITADFFPFAGGNGTAGDPYEIANWYHLHNVRYYLEAHFILKNNLDFTTTGYTELASPTANQGKGWQPIGFVSPGDDRLTGTLDGQGYEIRDLFINRPDENYIGLFGVVGEGGVVQNIGVVNADVTGYGLRLVGSLVAWNLGTVSNSYFTGSVIGSNTVGGLVAYSYGTVSDSYSTGSVTGDGDWIGGLVGENRGTVSNSYSSGNFTGNSIVGGLVGFNHDNGTVSNSYSTSSVTGDEHVGGLVGWNSGNVGYSYSAGGVTGDSWVGGLVGGSGSGSTVSNSYSSGSVYGSDYVGGLVGRSYEGTVSNSYFTGSVNGGDHAGGLVGENNGTVSNSHSTGSVTGNERVGGLVGRNYDSTVSNSYSTGSVTGNNMVGGLVGQHYEGIVSDSYSTGDVTGGWRVGGLVGASGYSTVSNSYSTSSVTGDMAVGGLVGSNWNWGTVSNSYSTGIVSGNSSVGGLLGANDGIVSDSFWDTETSGQSTSAGGTGKNTTEMQDIATFSGAGWNMIAVGGPGERNPAYIWNIVNGVTYPFLSWQP